MNRKTLGYLDDILGESKGFTTSDNFNTKKNKQINEAHNTIEGMNLDDLKKVKKQVDSLIERKEHDAKEKQQNSGFTGESF